MTRLPSSKWTPFLAAVVIITLAAGLTMLAVQAPRTTQKPGVSGSGACKSTGCSGQLCLDADKAEEIVTTCEYRAEYACFKKTKCERQSNGNCGWTQTTAFTACLKNPPPLE